MTTTDRSGRSLWLAAGGCATAGVLLLGATLLAGADPDPGPERRQPPVAAASASESDPTSGPDRVARSIPALTPTTVVPEHAHAHEYQDEAPTVPQALPLPADQVQGHSDEHPPAAAADEQQWQPVLTGFAHDFTNPGTSLADWVGRLARWTTSDLAAAYQGVDAAEIPNGSLLELTPSDVGTFSLSFTARYDGGLVLRGQAALGPTSWQVIAAEPVNGA